MGAKTHFQYYTKNGLIFQQKFIFLTNLNTILILFRARKTPLRAIKKGRFSRPF
jgi:hypothetical protein